jgi:RNA polymerase sigma-70 factor (ECF subfamily)
MDHDPTQRTSLSLLDRLRRDANDQLAWSELVRRYGSQIYRWCRRQNLQEADAQDATQAVLAKLAQKMRDFRYDPRRSFRAYLRTLTRYACCDLLADRHVPDAGSGDSQVLQLLQSAEARTDLEQQLNAAFDKELLDEAMERVRQRVEAHTWEAFRLTAQEGLSGAEAAERLGLRVSTVFKARSKVQKMLREEIERLEADPESEPGGAP